MKRYFLSLCACLAVLPSSLFGEENQSFDVVVFGGTPAGIMAAVAAGRHGQKAVVIEPSYLLGGMMAGGLTKTDVGKTETIGGLSKEFFDRVVEYYTKKYGADSEEVKSTDGGYLFEPNVSGEIFREMLKDAKVTVLTKEQLQSVQMEGQEIKSITTKNYETGRTSVFSGKEFIDATYEGDLMAAAKVMYRVGREAQSEFNESLAGMNAGPEELHGSGDHRIQAYNIRGTITNNPELRLPFPKPKVYYPEAAAGWVANIKANNYKSVQEAFATVYKRWALVNGKGDPNCADFPGVNFGYPEGDYEYRARILQKVQDYWISYWWRLQNDPDLPKEFLADMQNWGVPKDEYLESNHISPQIYVRVARRMLGRYFLTQHDVQEDRFKPDTICMGSYNTDCHDIQTMQVDGGLTGEGHFNGSADPWEIPYRSITPYGVKNLLVVCAVSASHVAYSSLRMEPVFMMLGHAAGLAADLAIQKNVSVQDVPIAELQAELKAEKMPLEAPFRPVVDIKVVTPPPYKAGQPIEFELVAKQERKPFTNISWNFDGSGEVQATTEKATFTYPADTEAKISLAVQDGDKLKARTVHLDLPVGEKPVPEIEVHYYDAKLVGRWDRTRGTEMEYRHRVGLMTVDPGKPAEAIFSTKLPRTGRYEVALAFPTAGNRATSVPVTITTADGTSEVTINQKKKETPFAFLPLGEFKFDADKPAVVTVKNTGANGIVSIDTVRFVWRGE